MGIEQINEINDRILGVHPPGDGDDNTGDTPTVSLDEKACSGTVTHKGKLITDATACPQDIAYPTDLNLLNDARKKSEVIIDFLHGLDRQSVKPRTYRKLARKDYLNTAQKKKKTYKVIRQANRKQLNYLKRNLQNIDAMLDGFKELDRKSVV